MFWNNFVFLCSKHNTTPNAVCSELKLSNAAATHWKNGSVPHDTTLKKIADHFNVSTDYLRGTEKKEINVPDYTYALFRGDEEITDEMQNEVEAYAQSIIKRLALEQSKRTSEQEELINLYVSAPPEIQAAALAVLKSAEAARKSRDDEKANQ